MNYSNQKQATPSGQANTPPQPLSENDVFDMAEAFDDTKGLTFIFLAGINDLNGAHELGPNYISAVELAIAHSRGIDCEGPFRVSAADPAPNKQETIELVRGRIELLNRCGNVSFFLLWNAHGDPEPRLDHSEDISEERVRQELVCYLQAALAWTLD